MKNWKKVKIGNVCQVGDGAHASIKRVDSGKAYLSSKNFTKDGITLNSVEYISLTDFDRYFKGSSKAVTKPITNDILISIIATFYCRA